MGFSKLVQKYKLSPKQSKSGNVFYSEQKSPKDDPLEICIDIESPPCVLYGSATESSGALLSGLLSLRVKNPYDSIQTGDSGPVTPVTSGESKRKSAFSISMSNTFSNLSVSNSQSSLSAASSSNVQIMAGYTKVTVTSVILTLVQKVHFHRPFVADLHSIRTCLNCQSKTTNIKTWDIQKSSKDLAVGQHSFPFSCLIPGAFPAKAALGSNSETEIKYELWAMVTYKDPRRGIKANQKDQFLQLVMPIPVTRSLPRLPDRNSLRVFPPTELTATAVLPSVVYPKSTFPLEMNIKGISVGDRRWRMRKLTWRIDEITRIRNHACELHKHELKKLEKSIAEKEQQKSKKPDGLKKYTDQGPQVTLSVSTPYNTPLPFISAISSPQDRSEGNNDGENNNHNHDNNIVSNRDHVADDESNGAFVHPNDDALRQEITMYQQRLREQHLQQELKGDSNLFTEETRTVTRGEMRKGWKTDFDNSGQIDLVTEIDCMPLNSGITNPITSVSTSKSRTEHIKQRPNVACDIHDPALGIYVSHILAVEIVVAEEALRYTNGHPVKKSTASANDLEKGEAGLPPDIVDNNPIRQAHLDSEESQPPKTGSTDSKNDRSEESRERIISTPTGAARVLRMQFRVHLTERSGLGISWDEEVPPIYQDVKMLSPPSYSNALSVTPMPRNLSPHGRDEFISSQESGAVIASIPNPLSTPPVAHHHDSPGTFRGLTAVQSPQLDSVISIQGNVPFQNNVLTPNATRDIRFTSMAELMDADRITQ